MRSSPLLIAHRGASAVAPEGTCAAIRAAARSGAGMVELDLQMTRDGRLVVLHDERLNRTTNGSGRLADWRYAALARLDAGSWFHPRFQRERILLLSQALRAVPTPMQINVELKRSLRRRAWRRPLMRLMRGKRFLPRVLLSSFEPTLLTPLRSSGVRLALICRREADRSLALAIRLGCWAWHPFHALVTPRRVALAHAAGLRVHAWTVDDVERARRLIRLGVDGVFTNDPARLRRIRP